MTKVQITLPDQLVQAAQRAGLLTPESIERLLREATERQLRIDELFEAMDQIAAVNEPPLSPEQVAEEIKAMRADRRRGAA